MTKCNHESLTIDRYCNDCGYDLIVDDREDAIRQQEQQRIIKLLEEHTLDVDGMGAEYCEKCSPYSHIDYRQHLIALIKGEK